MDCETELRMNKSETDKCKTQREILRSMKQTDLPWSKERACKMTVFRNK